jgi:hypothetical protein
MNLRKPTRTRLAVSLSLAASALAFSFISLNSSAQVADSSIPSNREIFGYIQDVTDFGPRRTGSEANVKTADYIAGKLREFGVQNVEIEQGDTYQWNADRWGLAVGGVEIPSFYMRHSYHPGGEGSFNTGPNGLQAEFVYIGDRDDVDGLDVKGKIVVADVELGPLRLNQLKWVAEAVHDPDGTLGSHDRLDPFTPNNYPHNFVAAMDAGAVGFVGILSNYFDSNRFYNEDLAYFVRDDALLSLPGLWVAKEDGEKLKAIIKKSPKAVGRMDLAGSVAKVKYRNVVGYLPGKSPETLMVQSHHDSGFQGAVEDASGVGAVLGVAKYYGQMPAQERQRSMMFALMDTHFTDYKAHEDFAHKHLTSKQVDVVANVTLEHIAREMKVVDGQAVMTGEVEPRILITSPSLLSLAEKLVVDNDYRRSVVASTSLFAEEDEGLPTDVGPIQKLAGFPVISLISAPTYLYDISDTLDKVAVEQLQPTVKLAIDLLDALDVAPRDELGRDTLGE